MPAVIVLVAVSMLVVISYITATGMQSTYQASFGTMLNWLADKFKAVRIPIPFHTIHPLRFVGNSIDALNRTILHSLGWIASKNGRKIADWMLGLALLWSGLGVLLPRITSQMLAALHALRHDTIPRLIGGHTRPIVQRTTRVTKYTETVVQDRVPGLEREISGVRKRLAALAAAVAGGLALPHAGSLEWPRAKVKELEHGAEATRKRIARNEKLLAKLLGGAAVLVGLFKLGLGWLRCPNWKKAGPAVCGMDSNLLDDLLLGAIIVTGTVSVVEFTKAAQEVETVALDALSAFIRELPRV